LALLGAALVERWAVDRRAFWQAFAVMQVSNAAFAWGQVAYRDWRRRNPAERDLDIFGWLYLGGTLVALAWAALGSDWGELLAYSPQRWAALLYLGLIASGAGFFLWNTGATRVTPGALAAMNNLKSPLAVLAAGAACIIGAAAWGAAEKDTPSTSSAPGRSGPSAIQP
jgi:drug/metabolite transporter (DMT)-like permease